MASKASSQVRLALDVTPLHTNMKTHYAVTIGISLFVLISLGGCQDESAEPSNTGKDVSDGSAMPHRATSIVDALSRSTGRSGTNTTSIELDSLSVMGSIGSIAFSPSGQYLAMCDLVGSAIYIVDAASGKELRRFRPDLFLTDSIEQQIISDIGPVRHVIRRRDWKDTQGNPVSIEVQQHELNNRYENCVFTSDSTIMIGASVAFVMAGDDGVKGLGSRTTLVHESLDGMRRSVKAVLFGTSGYFPQSSTFQLGTAPGRLILDCMAAAEGPYRKDLDSAYCLSVVDFMGNRKGEFCRLPQEYVESKLGYGFLNPMYATGIDGDQFTLFLGSPVVRDENGKPIFTLPALKNMNSAFFSSFVEQSGQRLDSAIRLLRLQCRGLYVTATGGFVIPMRLSADSGGHDTWSVQETDKHGSLVRQIDFPRSCAEGIVEFVGYDRVRNNIAVFVLDDAGKCTNYAYSLFESR